MGSAMSNDSDKICTAVRSFITYLRSLDGDDRETGEHAAQNFERTLAVLTSDFEQGVWRLDYDIGGKGVLDRILSDEHLREVERFSDEIYQLLHPPPSPSDEPKATQRELL
jgi:hypothetical protein